MFPKLPKSRLELLENLNSMDIKTCKGQVFLLSNDTENGIDVFMCKQNLKRLCSP